MVANVQHEELPRTVARVEVDAVRQRVIAYDKDEAIVAVYPATVGSAERTFPVRGVQGDRRFAEPDLPL